MGIHAGCDTGTGRATCKICQKLITKEQIQIFISGYKTSGAIHSNPADCLTDLRINGREKVVEKFEEKRTWLEGDNDENN